MIKETKWVERSINLNIISRYYKVDLHCPKEQRKHLESSVSILVDCLCEDSIFYLILDTKQVERSILFILSLRIKEAPVSVN